jgi:hypothetical protein
MAQFSQMSASLSLGARLSADQRLSVPPLDASAALSLEDSGILKTSLHFALL